MYFGVFHLWTRVKMCDQTSHQIRQSQNSDHGCNELSPPTKASMFSTEILLSSWQLPPLLEEGSLLTEQQIALRTAAKDQPQAGWSK